MQGTRLASVLVAALLAVGFGAGCQRGGKDDQGGQGTKSSASAEKRPPAPHAKGPKSIDVKAVNRARATLVAACKKSRKGAANKQTLASLNNAVKKLTVAYEKNPDKRFRSSPKAPRRSMRTRLRGAAFILRHKCGRGKPVRIGLRLTTTARKRG